MPVLEASSGDAQKTAGPVALAGRILVVDDDHIVLDTLVRMLEPAGNTVIATDSAVAALQELERSPVDVVVVDVRLRDGDGLTVLRAVRQRWPDVPVIVISGYGTIESAVQAMKIGAFDYVPKPFRAERLRYVLQEAIQQRARERAARTLARRPDNAFNPCNVVGETYQMQRVFDLVEAVADSTATLLIHGETGTGKSLIARVVHQLSQRRERPFVEVSCGAIPETLLASELFGHTRGAFTGAVRDKDGKFRAAEGGTILLDEIACASASLQMKLLRVLQEKQFEPLGSNRTLTADVRVILATNVALQEEVKAGRFREDLYYRVNVVNIELPPLRERLSDIPLLAEHFFRLYAQRSAKPLRGFTEEALECMQRYNWPGNIRELANSVERAVVLTRHELIRPEDLPPQIASANNGLGAACVAARPRSSSTLKEALADPERQILLDALEANGWNRSRTAAALSINRTTLYKKMKRFRIRHPEGEMVGNQDVNH